MPPLQKKLLSIMLLGCLAGFCAHPIETIFRQAYSNFRLPAPRAVGQVDAAPREHEYDCSLSNKHMASKHPFLD
jgi:hypothetical protein